MYYVVVGGTKFQSGLVEAALSENYDVICVDGDEDCYCFSNYQLHPINISIRNISDVLESLSGFQILGASTCQSDIGVPLVGAINDEFRLGGPSLKISNIVSNKYKFRKFCFDNRLTQYESTLYRHGIDISNQIFLPPLAVKPSDSSGSRGVTKVLSLEGLSDALNIALKFSFSGEAIIEKWFDGEEFGCQVCVNDEGFVSYLFHADYVFNSIPYGHSLLTSPKKLAKDQIEFFLRVSGVRRAWLNFDLINTPESTEILEVGMRLGATELDALFSHCTGKSAYKTIVNCDYKFEINKKCSDNIFGVLFNPLENYFFIKDPIGFLRYLRHYSIYSEFDSNLKYVEPFINGTKRFGRFQCSSSIKNIEEIFAEALINFGERYD